MSQPQPLPPPLVGDDALQASLAAFAACTRRLQSLAEALLLMQEASSAPAPQPARVPRRATGGV